MVVVVVPERSAAPVRSAAVVVAAVAAVAKAAVVFSRVHSHLQQLRSADKLLSHHSSALKRHLHHSSALKRHLPIRMVLLESPWIQCQQLFDRRRLNCASAAHQTLLNERLSSVGTRTTIRFALQNNFCMAVGRFHTVCSQDDAWIVMTG